MLGSEVALLQLTGLPLSTVLEAEAHLGAALGGEAGAVSALRVLQLYLERLGCTLPVRAGPGLAGWRRRGLGTRGPGAPPPLVHRLCAGCAGVSCGWAAPGYVRAGWRRGRCRGQPPRHRRRFWAPPAHSSRRMAP